MKYSDDVSILLWTSCENSPFAYRGALARDPTEFSNASQRYPLDVLVEPFSMTHKGLRLTAGLVRVDDVVAMTARLRKTFDFCCEDPGRETLFLLLFHQELAQHKITAIILRRLGDTSRYARAYAGVSLDAKPITDDLVSSRPRSKKQTFFIASKIPIHDHAPGMLYDKIFVNCVETAGLTLSEADMQEPKETQLDEIIPPVRKRPSPGSPFVWEIAYRFRSSNMQETKHGCLLILRQDAKNDALDCKVLDGQVCAVAYQLGSFTIDDLLRISRGGKSTVLAHKYLPLGRPSGFSEQIKVQSKEIDFRLQAHKAQAKAGCHLDLWIYIRFAVSPSTGPRGPP
ncbi:hypothetical protein CCHL11_02150 [Colletotrichum chlorophyti]|uniref:Uncharacterized protein n=1 Tax=Colletotrichum chlorophyti TaxID=708187 RepID=A0A1Q8S6Y7_9PEZI|nr:hypothetical protein CCHL11_02150 [Colletotrichum chlorophyti]